MYQGRSKFIKFIQGSLFSIKTSQEGCAKHELKYTETAFRQLNINTVQQNVYTIFIHLSFNSFQIFLQHLFKPTTTQRRLRDYSIDTVSKLTPEALQATTSEGLAQGP